MTRSLPFAAPPSTLPGDPLGAVGQDPDQVRQHACDIVSADSRVCSTAGAKPPSLPKSYDLSWLSWLIWLLVIAAIVLLIVVVVRSITGRPPGARTRRRRTRASTAPADELELDVVAVDRSREPIDWRAEADGHRRAGRHRDALRCRYRALVGDLARRGLIDEIPGRTTGEERRQLHVVAPVAAPPFDEAADLFDGAWYGHAAVDAVDDDRFQALEQHVLAATATATR